MGHLGRRRCPCPSSSPPRAKERKGSLRPRPSSPDSSLPRLQPPPPPASSPLLAPPTPSLLPSPSPHHRRPPPLFLAPDRAAGPDPAASLLIGSHAHVVSTSPPHVASSSPSASPAAAASSSSSSAGEEGSWQQQLQRAAAAGSGGAAAANGRSARHGSRHDGLSRAEQNEAGVAAVRNGSRHHHQPPPRSSVSISATPRARLVSCEVTVRSHRSAASTLRFTPSCVVLASASQPLPTRGHRDQVTDFVFLDSGKKLVTCSKDKVIRVWDLDTQHCLQIVGGHHSKIWSMDVDCSEKFLVSGSADRRAVGVQNQAIS